MWGKPKTDTHKHARFRPKNSLLHGTLGEGNLEDDMEVDPVEMVYCIPGGLLPLHVAVLPDAELLHLAEEGVGGDGGVRPVLLPQDELDPLSGRSSCTKQDLKKWLFSGWVRGCGFVLIRC
jgi:hypothetical protein